MKNKLSFFVYITITSIVIWMILEIICRTYLEENYNRNFGEIFLLQNKNPEVILKADTTTSVWGKTFSTNSKHGRKTAFPYSKRKKTKLYLGDSVTMGCGVDDRATYTYLISEKDSSFNYLNPSVAGWTVNDYLNYLTDYLNTKQNTDSLEEVVVFYCLNDIYGSSKTADLPSVGNKGVLSTLSAFAANFSAVYKLLKLNVHQNSDHYFKYDLQFYSPPNEKLSSCISSLDAINQLMKNNNIKWSLHILPYRSCIEKKHQEILQFLTILQSKKINANYLAPIFDSQNSSSYFLWSDEIHFNEKGHQTIANFLLNKQ